MQWSRNGDQGKEWKQGLASLNSIEGPFQLVFEATVGYNQLSDIAIDDVDLIDGACNSEPGEQE